MWTRKRGVDEALVTQVENELRNNIALFQPEPVEEKANDGLGFDTLLQRVSQDSINPFLLSQICGALSASSGKQVTCIVDIANYAELVKEAHRLLTEAGIA